MSDKMQRLYAVFMALSVWSTTSVASCLDNTVCDDTSRSSDQLDVLIPVTIAAGVGLWYLLRSGKNDSSFQQALDQNELDQRYKFTIAPTTNSHTDGLAMQLSFRF